MPYEFRSIYLDDPIIEGRVLDVFTPRTVTQDIALFFVHGGGWRGGARACYHNIMRAFNAKGFICASTDYRLAGTTIADQVLDVRHGYDLFVAELARLARPPKVFVHGSSAGAHLAALLTLALPGQCGDSETPGTYRRQADWARPVGAALQSTPMTFEPWEDIFPHIWTSMQGIVGIPYERDPEAYQRVSPVEYVAPDSPPVFLLEAEHEHMFPLGHAIAFVDRMRQAGSRAQYKVYTRAEHGFFYDVTRRQQQEAFADILDFIESLA